MKIFKIFLSLVIAIVIILCLVKIFTPKHDFKYPTDTPHITTAPKDTTPDLIDPCKANPKLSGCEKG